ncbi:MAG: flavodoxin domain-containing protein [Clostridium sp.]
MKKIAVVYESKYGTTKRYAEWIAEELGATIFEKKSIKPSDLDGFSTIVYGGGLYAGGVLGSSLITKNFDSFKNKKLVLFTCGLSDPENEENIKGREAGISRTFNEEMREKIKFFHLRGGINYKKLGFMDKAMMAMVKRMVSKKTEQELNKENQELLETYGKVVDFTNRDSINGIVKYVKEIS